MNVVSGGLYGGKITVQSDSTLYQKKKLCETTNEAKSKLKSVLATVFVWLFDEKV